MHYVLLWVLEESRTAAEYLGTHVAPESFHPSPCFWSRVGKAMQVRWLFQARGTSLEAFVTDCSTLKSLTSIHKSKSISVCSVFLKPCALNSLMVGRAFETPVFPVPSCTTYQLNFWVGPKLSMQVLIKADLITKSEFCPQACHQLTHIPHVTN